MGSWATYGLGTENQDLPGFVSLISSGTQPSGGQGCWGSGFIPSVYQGVQCRSKGDPVLFVSDPAGMNREMRRKTLDTLQALEPARVVYAGAVWRLLTCLLLHAGILHLLMNLSMAMRCEGGQLGGGDEARSPHLRAAAAFPPTAPLLPSPPPPF